MNTPQVIEAASTVEQKSDSDSSLQWLMAEVDMYASQLEDAADELEETLGRFEDEEGLHSGRCPRSGRRREVPSIQLYLRN